ncbi:MAG: alpha/beta hydrolase [Ruthenibacterium sp.]
MIYKTILLNDVMDGWTQSDATASVTLYLQEHSKEYEPDGCFPCVVVCPGGGYEFTSDREGEPVALRFAGKGYSAAVVKYSTNHRTFPTQLCELSMVVAWLRRNAKAFHLQANHIAVCGFSAGGHLAASLCNLYSLPLLREQLPIAEDENRPDAALLCYPVISSGEFAHVGSFENLCGDVVDAKMRALLSLETSVHANCPPCFLWHTADDNAVPSENTLLYAMALRRYHIPLEMHIFLQGPHGLSLADCTTTNLAESKLPDVAKWFDWSVRFLDRIFAVPRS